MPVNVCGVTVQGQDVDVSGSLLSIYCCVMARGCARVTIASKMMAEKWRQNWWDSNNQNDSREVETHH